MTGKSSGGIFSYWTGVTQRAVPVHSQLHHSILLTLSLSSSWPFPSSSSSMLGCLSVDLGQLAIPRAWDGERTLSLQWAKWKSWRSGFVPSPVSREEMPGSTSAKITEWESTSTGTCTRGHQRAGTLGAWRLLPFQTAGQKDWKGQRSIGNDDGGRHGLRMAWSS